MKKAVVLCGGGSLGAYEVGVWKFLREIDYKFDIVTGSSIGALNGALMCYGDYDSCIKMWKQVDVNKVMVSGVNFDQYFFDETFSLSRQSKFYRFALSFFKNSGADIGPFKKMVKEAIDPHKVKTSNIKLGIVTTTFPGFKEKDYILQDVDENLILDYLHASSCAYPVFPVYKIGDESYVDGGYKNNLPIDLAIKMGATEIVAVRLDSFPKVPQHKELMYLPIVTLIEPTWPLGFILNFKQDMINKSMILGYLDAQKAFGHRLGVRYTFANTPVPQYFSSEFLKRLLEMGIDNYDKIIEILKWKKVSISSSVEYFLRGIEVFGEKVELDPFKCYEVVDYFKAIRKQLELFKKRKTIVEDLKRYKGKEKLMMMRNEKAFMVYLLGCFLRNNEEELNNLKEICRDSPSMTIIYCICSILEEVARKKVDVEISL